MAITRDTVHHIAQLARLPLTEDEELVFTTQLDHVFSYVENLNELDTEGIEPTAHIIPMATPFREDVVENRAAVEESLANAPDRDQRFFKVPKIIE